MITLSPKEEMLLALNQHGFLWIPEGDFDAMDNLLADGYCICTDEITRDNHPIKRYEITYLGMMNAITFKGYLEYQHEREINENH